MERDEFIKVVEAELPHIKYVIDCLHRDSLSSGALPDIYRNLKVAIEEVV